MFGYNRRPEPDTKRDHGMTGLELVFAATGGAEAASVSNRAIEIKRAHSQVFRGRKHAEDRDLLHAALPIADLWAFETGRLP